MTEILQNIGRAWQKSSPLYRVLLLTVLLACVGASALLVSWATKPKMTLLYSQLSREEAGKIVDKIRDADVPYELKDGGSTILVPEQEVHSLRLTMAQEGMPTSDQPGYKILDTEKIGTSPLSQRINLIRALEGELVKTIRMIDGVVAARVHVVRPEGALFAGRQQQASATVLVRLRSGKALTEENVATIQHLVAGGVEGLSPEHVVVVDGRGRLLSTEGTSELARGAGTFLDYKSRVEQYLARKTEDMLTSVLGPNRASVQVDATIETSRIKQFVETYDQENKVPSKEEIKSSSSSTPGGSTGAAAAAGSKEDEETILTEFLVGKTEKEQLDLPGQIKDLSVAVLVDLSPPPKKEGEEAAPAPSLTAADVLEIAQRATGATKDNIIVKEAAFFRPPLPEEAPEDSKDFILTIARRASLGILVVGALLALKIFGGKKPKVAAAALEGQAAQAGNLLPTSQGAASADVLRARITKALQDNPEEVRRLFLTWAQSEKGQV